MLKKFIRKGFAKLGVLALMLNVIAPISQFAQAADIDLRVGANEAGITMQVLKANNDVVFTGLSDNYPTNLEGFHVTGNLAGITPQHYIVTFTERQDCDVEIRINGAIKPSGTENGVHFVTTNALNDADVAEVLADYTCEDQPQEEAIINVTNLGVAGPVEVNLSGDDNGFAIVNENDTAQFVVAPGNYVVECEDNIPGFTLTQPAPNPFPIDDLQANDVEDVNCEYQADDPEPETGFIEVCKQVRDANGNVVDGSEMLFPVDFTVPGGTPLQGQFPNIQPLQNASFGTPMQYANGFECVTVEYEAELDYGYDEEFIDDSDVLSNLALWGQTLVWETTYNDGGNGGHQPYNATVQAPDSADGVISNLGAGETRTLEVINQYHCENENGTEVECDFDGPDPEPKTITIRVNTNDPDNDFEGTYVDISNNIANDDFIGDNDSEDYVVDADNGQIYTVDCRENISWNGEDYELVSSNPIQVDTDDFQPGDVVEVDCDYANNTSADEGIIRVHVNGPNSMNGAEVDVTPNVANNFFIAEDDDHDFEVDAGNGEDYTVTCEETVVEGSEVYELISNNPTQVNNIDENEVVNVYCNYEPTEEGQGTIRVHVDGPGNFNGATVDITPNITNNNFISEGDDESFDVPANGSLDYTVRCDDVNGYDVQGSNNKAVNNIDEGETVNVYCTYVDEDEDDEATIRVYVQGLDEDDEARVSVTDEPSRDIEEDNYYNFTVDGDGDDYDVRCEQTVEGDDQDFELVSDYPIEVNNVDDGDFRSVTCRYDEADGDDTEIIQVHVEGPTSLNEADVYIPGEFNDSVENGDYENVYVEAGEDYRVYCERKAGYKLVSDYPIQVNNINSTRSVTCEYEEDGLPTGFRVESSPSQQYADSGETISVTVRAINASSSSATGVELTHDYDQSKLELVEADGGEDNGNLVMWDLGTMSAGEVETFTLRFRVTGDEGETAQNNTRALVDQVNVDDVDNFVHILNDTQGGPTPPTPTVKYVYPETLYKAGPGVLSLLFAGLAALGYGLIRSRKTIIRRLKAMRHGY